MGVIRDVKKLIPSMQSKVDILLIKLQNAGIKYLILETLRTKEVQKAYYSQGRRPLVETNAARIVAGLSPINEVENSRKITWTLNSKHIEGKAIDIVLLKDGKPWWNAPISEWEKLGKLGEEAGLKWGGRWKNLDCPHFEVE